jgi:hypothetical protein
MLTHTGAIDIVHSWFVMLIDRLYVRRVGAAQIPFLVGRGSVELLLRQLANGEKPSELCGTSSVYLTCLMELVCSMPSERRDQLLQSIHRRLVLGWLDDGHQVHDCKPIDLMCWLPPNDWEDKVLVKSLASEGECVLLDLTGAAPSEPPTGAEIAERLAFTVAETRRKRPFTFRGDLPAAVVFLACLKHRTPLPPEFWRLPIFDSQDPRPNDAV